MGKTAFSGPAYGAKQLLFSASRDAVSTGAGNGVSTSVSACIVPAGEDWFATEFGVFQGSTGSSARAFWVQDDATVVSSITVTSTTTDANSQNVIAADAAEYEGTRIAAGSTVTFWVSNSSAQGAIANVTWRLSGYRRWVESSRDITRG